MTKRSIFVGIITLCCIGSLSVVQAHSLGQETLNKHSLFRVTNSKLELQYTLDMAEKPTFEELRRMDIDKDEYTTQAEADQYVLDTAERLIANIDLSVNGRPVALEVASHEFDVSMSGHDLPVLYLQYQFEADLTPAGTWSFEFDDANFPGSIGWHEVVVKTGSALELLDSTVATKDLSRQLAHLPQDLTRNPYQSSGTWVIAADAETGADQINRLLLILMALGATFVAIAGFFKMSGLK